MFESRVFVLCAWGRDGAVRFCSLMPSMKEATKLFISNDEFKTNTAKTETFVHDLLSMNEKVSSKNGFSIFKNFE